MHTSNPASINSLLIDQTLINAWEKVKSPPFYRDQIPNGKYIVIVKDVYVEETTDGKRLLKWDLQIVEGLHEGKSLYHKNQLETDTDLKYLKRELYTAKVFPETLTNFEYICEELKDKHLEIYVKIKGDYRNTYLNKAVDHNKNLD